MFYSWLPKFSSSLSWARREKTRCGAALSWCKPTWSHGKSSFKAWAVPAQHTRRISAGKAAWDTLINNNNKGYIPIAAELLWAELGSSSFWWLHAPLLLHQDLVLGISDSRSPASYRTGPIALPALLLAQHLPTFPPTSTRQEFTPAKRTTAPSTSIAAWQNHYHPLKKGKLG